MSIETTEAERAACKAAGGGVFECSAHMLEWKGRHQWIGGIVAAAATVLGVLLERGRWR